jgi:hypothetical protein
LLRLWYNSPLRCIFVKGISILLITVALIIGMTGSTDNVGGSEPYTLSINSTPGGSVTEPGEGIFNYDQGTVVNLKAEPQEGYRFVDWSGGVDTITNVNAAATNITIEGDYSISANFEGVGGDLVGIKAGDWIKLEYSFTGWPADQTYPEWLKLEFISIEGTTVAVRFTQRLSDGTEESDTATFNIIANIEVPELGGIIIPADRAIGEYVYVAGHGNVAIEDEVIKTYAGANRTVIYTSFWPTEAQVTYYWDKSTGVMVELSSTSPDFTATARAVATNMWETGTIGIPWWPWIIVGVVAVGLVIFFVRRKRPTQTKRR